MRFNIFATYAGILRNMLFAIAFTFLFSITAFSATYTVDTLTDAADDGECVTDTTIRDAIACAGANVGQDTINFSVTGPITLTNDFADIAGGDSDGVILDCAGSILFDGNLETYHGFQFTSGNSTIRACTFTDMRLDALFLNGDNNTVDRVIITGNAIELTGNNNTITGSYIGLGPDGNTESGEQYGIEVKNGTGNVIGGSDENDGNVIADQSTCGIGIVASDVDVLTISGNYIGMNANGDTPKGNGIGICIDNGGSIALSDAITIGGASQAEANVISGNTSQGIYITNATFASTFSIIGNIIGLTPSADSTMGNGTHGLDMNASSCSTLTNCSITGNYVGGNANHGIKINNSGARIQKNYIGTNNAFENLGNGNEGIAIEGGADNVIVGFDEGDTISTLASKANFIGYTGNSRADIKVDGAGTDNNSLRGNIFNLSATDTSTNIELANDGNNAISYSGTSITTKTNEEIAGTTDLADGTLVDIYSLAADYSTSFLGTATVASSAFSLTGSFTADETLYYQLTEADGDSGVYQTGGDIISTITGLADFSIHDGAEGLSASWTAASSSTFDHYEIWFGTDSDDVANRTGTATEWDNDDDSDLSTVTTHSTVITSAPTDPGITYYAKIWGITAGGTELTLDTASYFTGVSGSSSAPSTSEHGSGGTDSSTDDSNHSDNTDESHTERRNNVIVLPEEITDHDYDGLSDDEEAELGTDPYNRDSDRDGLSDYNEVKRLKTNPLSVDTDKDGITDNQEVLNAFDPTDICDPGGINIKHSIREKCLLLEEGQFINEEGEIEDIHEEEEVVEETDEEEEITMDEVHENVKGFTGKLLEFDNDVKWSRRYYQVFLNNENLKRGMSASPRIRTLIESLVENPKEQIRKGNALALAMIMFNGNLIEDSAIVDSETNDIFVERAFAGRILNKFFNQNFDKGLPLTRADGAEILFKASDQSLGMKFDLRLEQNFGFRVPPCNDFGRDESYAAYMYYLLSKNVIAVNGGSCFPEHRLSKAEFVKMLSLIKLHKEYDPADVQGILLDAQADIDAMEAELEAEHNDEGSSEDALEELGDVQ